MNYDPIHDTFVGQNGGQPQDNGHQPIENHVENKKPENLGENDQKMTELHQHNFPPSQMPTRVSDTTNAMNISQSIPNSTSMTGSTTPGTRAPGATTTPGLNMAPLASAASSNHYMRPHEYAVAPPGPAIAPARSGSTPSFPGPALASAPRTAGPAAPSGLAPGIPVALPVVPIRPAQLPPHYHEYEDEHEELEEKPKTKRPVSASVPKGIRFLKKLDGEPFWRKDIQYDFLDALFENDQRVFTNPFPYFTVAGYHPPSKENKCTFSELYVRTLAESPKCSKVLKERLLRDVEMGKLVAKVCLLVNTGRMNTTINFVPEMRSTLRTYHSIPSLQADPVTGASKPLQDTPRLKSILKAVSDAKEDFKSLNDLLENPPQDKPNTNLVFLLFLLSNSVNGIKFHNNDANYRESTNSFMEFFLETKVHPANRAKRFLWLMYTYLETSFTPQELANNPFNPHEMPPLEYLREEEVDNFDKDTDYEIEYSQKMFKTRLKYLADEEHQNNPKRGNKSKRDKEEDEEEDEPEKPDKKKKKLGKPASSKIELGLPEVRSFDDGSDNVSSKHLRFPLPSNDIKQIAVLNDQFDSSSYFDTNEILTASYQEQIILRFQSDITKRLEDENPEEFESFKQWLEKYFQYKKLTLNGLVGMEWEDIRYDLIHGIEDHMYKVEEEGIKPIHDFDLIHEKTRYIYEIISNSVSYFKELPKKTHGIKFDLEKEEMFFV